ncbi:hypothetical protein BC828DRAFT_372787 [Blastocladiella britannica]|nr:hypothetical protein BC828DRAFT_372787 [Blastocladiella britannica]
MSNDHRRILRRSPSAPALRDLVGHHDETATDCIPAPVLALLVAESHLVSSPQKPQGMETAFPWSAQCPASRHRHVDYLHHAWTDHQLRVTWRLLARLKRVDRDLRDWRRGDRLEALAWRVWAQRHGKLDKVHPYAIGWEKDDSTLCATGPLWPSSGESVHSGVIGGGRGRGRTGCLKRPTLRDALLRISAPTIPPETTEPPGCTALDLSQALDTTAAGSGVVVPLPALVCLPTTTELLLPAESPIPRIAATSLPPSLATPPLTPNALDPAPAPPPPPSPPVVLSHLTSPGNSVRFSPIVRERVVADTRVLSDRPRASAAVVLAGLPPPHTDAVAAAERWASALTAEMVYEAAQTAAASAAAASAMQSPIADNDNIDNDNDDDTSSVSDQAPSPPLVTARYRAARHAAAARLGLKIPSGGASFNVGGGGGYESLASPGPLGWSDGPAARSAAAHSTAVLAALVGDLLATPDEELEPDMAFRVTTALPPPVSAPPSGEVTGHLPQRRQHQDSKQDVLGAAAVLDHLPDGRDLAPPSFHQHHHPGDAVATLTLPTHEIHTSIPLLPAPTAAHLIANATGWDLWSSEVLPPPSSSPPRASTRLDGDFDYHRASSPLFAAMAADAGSPRRMIDSGRGSAGGSPERGLSPPRFPFTIVRSGLEEDTGRDGDGQEDGGSDTPPPSMGEMAENVRDAVGWLLSAVASRAGLFV